MNIPHKNRLFSNFIALGIVQFANFLLPLLLMPYVISKIGAAEFGVITVAQVVMTYLSSVSDYGFNLTATRSTALHDGDQQKTSKIFFTVLATKLIITAFLFILLVVLTIIIPLFKNHFILYRLGFICVPGQALLVSWFFQGKEKMQYVTVSTLISRLLFVALVVIFIHHKEDGIYFLFFLGAGNIIAGLLSIFFVIHMYQLTFSKPAWADIAGELKGGWQITVSNLSVSTYMYSSVFILRIFTTDLIVGYYSVAERIFFAIRQVLSVFSQVAYPRICYLSQQGETAVNAFFKRVYLPFLLLILLGCSVLFVAASPVVHIFLAGAPALPVLLLQLLSVVPIIVCLNIPACQLLLAFNHKKSYLMTLGAGTIINVLLNIVLTGNLGATGTVLSIVTTELFITAVLNRQVRKHKLSGFIIPGTNE